eukprot:UN07276
MYHDPFYTDQLFPMLFEHLIYGFYKILQNLHLQHLMLVECGHPTISIHYELVAW